MNIVTSLNEELLNQVFGDHQEMQLNLSLYQNTAMMYARTENAIAVLSDMKANVSYLYKGAVADRLGFSDKTLSNELNSIWEEEIFNRIHPEDLINKHLLELQFFNMLKSVPIAERVNFYVYSKIRILNAEGSYQYIKHRMFYISSFPNGSLWLALCLYNMLDEDLAIDKPERAIVNSATGEITKPDDQKTSNILSAREKEILSLIRNGKMSMEIAGLCAISINTVNRHRQNILEKLRVSNSHEACRIAELMRLI